MRDAFVAALLLSGQFILVTRGMANEILLPFGTLAHTVLLHLPDSARFRAVLYHLVLFAHLVACTFRFELQAFQVAASRAVLAYRTALRTGVAKKCLRFGTSPGTAGTACSVCALALLGAIHNAMFAHSILSEACGGLGSTLAAYLGSPMRTLSVAPYTQFLGFAALVPLYALVFWMARLPPLDTVLARGTRLAFPNTQILAHTFLPWLHACFPLIASLPTLL